MVKKQPTKQVPQSAEEFFKQRPDMDPQVAAKKQAEKDAYVAHFQGKDSAEVIARRDAAAKKKPAAKKPEKKLPHLPVCGRRPNFYPPATFPAITAEPAAEPGARAPRRASRARRANRARRRRRP